MKLKELIKYEDYHCPIVEFYDTDEKLVFMINLQNLEFWDIDVLFDDAEPYGVIMLKEKRDEETEHDD